jgi:hypothetical protein
MTNHRSVYIPRVHNDSHAKTHHKCLEDFMSNCFHKLDIGRVSHIDFVPIPGSKGKPSSFSKAFVHFSEWYNTPPSYELQSLLDKDMPAVQGVSQGPPTQVMYDATHYWIIKPNKSHINDRTKIGSLEKQVGELTAKLSTCTGLLDSATSQLSRMTSCDNSADIEELPYKRKRDITFNN